MAAAPARDAQLQPQLEMLSLVPYAFTSAFECCTLTVAMDEGQDDTLTEKAWRFAHL